jgi:hypothetical protein
MLERNIHILTLIRWLVAKERTAEAHQILTRYHAGGDENSPLVAREMSEIVQAIRQEQAASAVKWSTLVATPGNRKRLLIAVCLGAFAQWNGIGYVVRVHQQSKSTNEITSVVSYYLTLVLNSIGITDSFDQTLINGLLQVRLPWGHEESDLTG